MEKVKKKEQRDFRKKLNQQVRQIVSNSVHKDVKLIVHTPDCNDENKEEYSRLKKELMPVVSEIARKTLPLLQYEVSQSYTRNHYYGGRFQADSVAYRDFRYFSRKNPPTESPSLAVALRVDESASMSAYGRLEAAKRAVLAVFEFCRICNIPVLIYGDTADISRMEQMSIYAYTDFTGFNEDDGFKLMGIKARSNNRDGMALRIIAGKLLEAPQRTKLLVSISDGQPKAMEDYTGNFAAFDMKQTISEYERKGITFLAAAIGQDKEVIGGIYGQERFIDISDLNSFPARLVGIIFRYI